jgi:putative PIN family toxin of toxin-antitoxin system
MKIVLDTNVLVSGLLTPYSTSARIINLITSGAVVLCYDSRIFIEYKEVLSRPKFQFDPKRVSNLLAFIEMTGEITAPNPLNTGLPDPDDAIFLETALAAGAVFLITGNVKHFPEKKRQTVRVVTPQEFLSSFK